MDISGQQVADLALAKYAPASLDDILRCGGHRDEDIVGYVARHILDSNGDRIPRPGEPGRLGVDLRVVACRSDCASARPRCDDYFKALRTARAHRGSGSWAVVDKLYRCGHRGGL